MVVSGDPGSLDLVAALHAARSRGLAICQFTIVDGRRTWIWSRTELGALALRVAVVRPLPLA